jgi:nucleotide-binding universal stress UspA family protein
MSIFPTKILVAVDGSEEAGLAVEAATGSEVHIVHVLPTEERLLGYQFYSEEMRESIIERAEKEARSFLEKQAQRISSEGG